MNFATTLKVRKWMLIVLHFRFESKIISFKNEWTYVWQMQLVYVWKYAGKHKRYKKSLKSVIGWYLISTIPITFSFPPWAITYHREWILFCTKKVFNETCWKSVIEWWLIFHNYIVLKFYHGGNCLWSWMNFKWKILT